MSSSSRATFRPRLRLQEGGLLGVVFLLGLLLTLLGGKARFPVFETNAQGEQQRVFRVNEAGEREPVFVERNKFLNVQNLAQLAKDTSFVAIMAIGATFVIISGGIDLSVGAIYGLASVLAAMVFHKFGPQGSMTGTAPWFGVALGMLTCIGVGTFCGLANGGMIVALRVHPFIITLGTMAIFRGIAFVMTRGQSITDFPPALTQIVKFKTAGLTLVPSAIMLLTALIGGTYLIRLAMGRRIYAVGGNELASRFSGIRVERVKLSVYVIAGLTAGIAALLAIGYYSSGTSSDGTGRELNVIAAAVVGGASLTGGKGSALGALLGALIIQMIDSGIVILGIDQNYSQIIMGAAIIIAVWLEKFSDSLAKRKLAAKA
jgi:ribose transport system permease protein